ncbi:hypothetical protein BaRGS_00029768 [Batillaria attramentaria]|uniref:Uncharacterized protein n=1 Tax=Batillaria attramentaria TaxID=370345 RepID=A0ABD0JVK1_9CAEN
MYYHCFLCTHLDPRQRYANRGHMDNEQRQPEHYKSVQDVEADHTQEQHVRIQGSTRPNSNTKNRKKKQVGSQSGQGQTDQSKVVHIALVLHFLSARHELFSRGHHQHGLNKT